MAWLRAKRAPATLLLLACAALVLPSSCKDPDPGPDGPESCDAGDAAFVARALPLVVGRKAHGADELALWTRIVEEHGRPTAVRAMTFLPGYVDHWTEWLMDELAVARIGDQQFSSCYSAPLLDDHDGSLAAFIASTPPREGVFGEDFNMVDVLRSSLVADDLSVPWQAHLLARMGQPLEGANVSDLELERNRRVQFGEVFFATYLGRNLTCLSCHNATFSVTSHQEPTLNRHWPLAGHVEEALFGAATGAPAADVYSIFRYQGVADVGSVQPWGMSLGCGAFSPDAPPEEDLLGAGGVFIGPRGPDATVFDVEEALANGVADLRDGLDVGGEGAVDGAEALAALVGQHITNRVWTRAMGAPLTIGTFFPRNEAQQTLLATLSDGFVRSGFSLRTLLVEATAHPVFNMGTPDLCDAQTYGLAPLLHPFSIHEEDEARRGNGIGDRIHRLDARTAMRAIHDALGWPQIPHYTSAEVRRVQADIGAFLRASEPGFAGTDLQGLLAFEAAYGFCAFPFDSILSDLGLDGEPPLEGSCTVPGNLPGCDDCACEACVCDADPYCCDTAWDDVCVDQCQDDCGGCPAGDDDDAGDDGDPQDGDWITGLVQRASAEGYSLGQSMAALRDRVLAQPEMNAREQALIEDLLSTDLDTVIAGQPLDTALRAYCGALLVSPQFYLALPPEPGAAPGLLDPADCAAARDALAQVGATLACD